MQQQLHGHPSNLALAHLLHYGKKKRSVLSFASPHVIASPPGMGPKSKVR